MYQSPPHPRPLHRGHISYSHTVSMRHSTSAGQGPYATLKEWCLPTTRALTQFLQGNPNPSIVPLSLLASSSTTPPHAPAPTPPTNYRWQDSSAPPAREGSAHAGFLRFPPPPAPHTSQVCTLPPGPPITHRASPAAGLRLLHTHLHSGSPPPPPPPRAPSPARTGEPATRARAHTCSRFRNLPRAEASRLRGDPARPAAGAARPLRRLARGSSSPHLPPGKEDTATPPPPRIYHLWVGGSMPQPAARSPPSGPARHSPEILRAQQAHPPPPRLPAKPLGFLRLLGAAPRPRGCWRPPPSSSPPAPPRSAGGWG